jgi:MoaA/NifB/PqqE/SkfB family radical SAM enzyme
MNCAHCPHEDFKKSELFQGKHLDITLHTKLVDEIARDGKNYCKYLRYTGQGETLLHPKLIEMIAYASARTKIPTNITTNGLLLTGNKAGALLEAGVDAIDISLDANSAKTYELIRKNENFDIVKANILKLIELIRIEGFKTKVVVSFVEQSLNKHESQDFEKCWKVAGADYVVIRRLHSAGGVKAESVRVNASRYPCLYPWERLTLSPDGFIHYCPQDWIHGSVVCDFRENTIKDIWQSPFMQRLREAHLNNNFSKHAFCRQCPDWSTTRWPDEDRSYSNMMQDFSSFREKQKR